MADTDIHVTLSSSEKSPLLNSRTSDSVASDRRESIRRRSSSSANEATKKERFRAIRICYFGMFVSSIVFSITVSSLWPFLQIVDISAEAVFLGWLVAAFSIGQLIASPAIGYIANRTNNNKMPLVISTALIAVSNLLYAYVESIHTPHITNKWWIMLARFIMGVGAANSTIMRSYASSATTLAERTNVMANLSAYQGVGFILGPLIQALFAFLGYPGPVHKPWLYLNIYTAPAFFSAVVAIVNLLLFLLAFKDVRVAIPTRRSVSVINGSPANRATSATTRHDQSMAILCCLYMFFVAYLTFTNYETIASPLSIDMYSWSKEESTRNNGYILGVLGFMSVGVLIVTKLLARRFQDRALTLLGMIISFLGYFVFLPWGSDYPSTQIASYTPTTVTSTRTTTSLLSTTTAEAGDKGCPLNYQWCYTVPRVQLWQYITASIVITTGFSITNVICYSIFSKKLGDRPQGTMMGIFTSAGSLARAFGPIAVGFLYKNWGPRPMMIFMLVFVFSSILALIFNYKRLDIEPEVPDDISDDEESHINSNGTIAE